MPRNFQVILRTEQFVTEDVSRFVETQELGQPGYAVVEACTDEPFMLDEAVGSAAELAYGYEGEEPRRFWGIVQSVEIIGRAGTQAGEQAVIGYRLRLVSRLELLEGAVDSRIFQEQDVEAIVSEVCANHAIDAGDLEWKLTASYSAREYCVQYQETGLHFVSRLLEQEGIYFYAEAKADEEGETIVFADDSTAAPSIEGEEALPLRARAELQPGEDAIFAVHRQHRVRSGKFVLRDFDFERPSLDLTATAASDAFTDLEVYDYPGEYFEPAEGKRLAQVRLEEEQAARATVRIESNSPRLRAGRIFAVSSLDGDERFFATRVVHDCVMHGGESREGTGVDYAVEVEAVPAGVKYRPPRLHPAPVIDGPQTAVVVAPEGAPAEEIHTDEHGRCKVRFHWDRSGEAFDKASCWMRVAQLQTSGSMALPRVHWEVIVEFLEGNPDRPVVTGRLYNGLFMPPYALPEGRTRMSLRTGSTPGGGGSNEIRFEDKAGSEEIMINSQYNTTVAAANNRSRKVQNCDTLTIGVNATIDVGANQDIKITNGHKCSVGASQTVNVGGNRSVEVNAVCGLTVGGSASTTVGGNHFEMNGSPLAGLIATASAAAASAVAAKAAAAVAKIEGAVQGKIDQAMGPLNDLAKKASSIEGPMAALADGQLGASASLTAAAVGMPTAAGVFGALRGGPAAFNPAGGADPAGLVAATNAVSSAVAGAVGGAMARVGAAAKAALGEAAGTSSGGGGGESMGNVGGPDGAVGGVSESDSATGPGHSQYKISGSHSETTGAMRVTLAAGGINLNVSGPMNQSVGAALIELAAGDHAESVDGVKCETQAGLVVLAKGGESEKASGAMSTLVGGAMLEKVNGDYSVEAGAAATFIGAFHKVDASGKITFKCGASSVVVDGSGVTITSPLVSFSGGSVQITKTVNDV